MCLYFTQSLCFAISGEYLTARIRSRVFRAILRQVSTYSYIVNVNEYVIYILGFELV